MPIHRKFLAVAAGLLSSTLAHSQSSLIRLDQVGYPVGTAKFAVYRGTDSGASLVNATTGAVVASIDVGPLVGHNYAGKVIDTNCRVLDFTNFNTAGTYKIKVGSELSYPFTISTNPHMELSKASIKAFWYNRSSFALTSTYAGTWARAAGHTAKAVIHPSAATAKRPSGTLVSSPGGWYDAGDYGRYIVNAGITMWTMLDLYESTSAYLDTLKLNVPKGSTSSDYVNELAWELRWMLTMQDPDDGGVYHKLTSTTFPTMQVMPAADTTTQYLVQKSTAATLDFAAVMAQAYRVLQGQTALKSLTDSCLSASRFAWQWARANPDSNYVQATFNKSWLPKVATGAYDDAYPADEFNWAAAELFLATQEDSFATVVPTTATGSLLTAPFAVAWGTPNWEKVGTLGWLSLVSHKSLLTGSMSTMGTRLDSSLKILGNKIKVQLSSSANPYKLILGSFPIGSNSVFANNGIILWKTWQATGDTSYRNASLEALHYVLGRNLIGNCFVTGFGGLSPQYPHHRPSNADGVTAPVPGFLVGGPFHATSALLAPTTYIDGAGSSDHNEVTINWNAPLAYLTNVWSAALPLGPVIGISSHNGFAAKGLELSTRNGAISARMAGTSLARLELLGIDGRLLARTEGPAESLELSTNAKGLLLVRAVGTNGQSSTGRTLLP